MKEALKADPRLPKARAQNGHNYRATHFAGILRAHTECMFNKLFIQEVKRNAYLLIAEQKVYRCLSLKRL